MKQTRMYELDWLRIIAIVILLYFHTGMFFNTWGWHIKNNETTVVLDVIMAWLHVWRMPLLLVISGAGTFFALGFRTKGMYAGERFKRLIIPLIFGMIFIVPPQIYMEKINDFASYWSFWPTIFDFVPYPKGNTSWHHLWFILYLFIYSIVLLPFFLFLRSDRSLRFRTKVTSLLSSRIGFGWILIGMIGSQFLFRPFFPEEKHNLTDLGYMVHYGLYFLSGFLIYSNPELRNILKQKRKIHLILAGMALPLFYVAWFVPYKMAFYKYDFFYHIPATATSWYFILALLGYGQTALKKPSKWLKPLNEGLYPFYILHQTVTILIAYPLGQLEWNLWLKFAIVSTGTLIICISIYWLLIQPFNLMRLFFGMKPLKTKERSVYRIKQDTLDLNPS